ncbi:MAG: hypothetical protein GW948_02175 [Rhodobacterales bacterium]|nr:hypothetical protein [Rhodobacterales bacterium]
MAALTEGRLTPRREGDYIEAGVAASTRIFPGALVMRNAAGFLLRGATATGSVGVGVADREANNTAGSAGDITARVQIGTFLMGNSAAGDAIAIADIGNVCFIVDDQTVAKTDGTGTRSPAGIVADVTSLGVWVRFDEALTAAAAA